MLREGAGETHPNLHLTRTAQQFGAFSIRSLNFKTHFSKGDLKEIHLEEWKKEDNKKRIQSQEKIFKKLKEAQKKQYSWAQKLKSYYNFIIRFIAGILSIIYSLT